MTRILNSKQINYFKSNKKFEYLNLEFRFYRQAHK